MNQSIITALKEPERGRERELYSLKYESSSVPVPVEDQVDNYANTAVRSIDTPFVPQALTPHVGAARAREMGARPGRLEESASPGRGGESKVHADQAAEAKSSLVSPYSHARWAGAVNNRDSCYICPNNKMKSPRDALRICSFWTERSTLFQSIAPALRRRGLGPGSAPRT